MRSDGDPAEAGGRVEAWIFLGVGAAVLVVGLVYLVLAAEEAGVTMLVLTAALGALTGGYLLRRAGEQTDPAAAGAPGTPGTPEDAYLPHASVWPLGLGAGCVVVANGLALGAWALVPGAMLTTASLWGFARQSRRRD